MIGLGILLIPIGYVMVYTGFAGDGSTKPDGKKSYSLGTAFVNAAKGSFIHPAARGG
jgi:hypothetical protein